MKRFCRISFPSTMMHCTLNFVALISMTSFYAFSCRGSNSAFRIIFCACTAFSSSCNFFIFEKVLIFSSSDIVIFCCFMYSMATCIFSSFPFISCNIPSSRSCVHIWVLFSNNFFILYILCVMLSAEAIASHSLCSLDYGVFVVTSCSPTYFISSF
jgi:hypothetical protein